jgi:hypothetical protein
MENSATIKTAVDQAAKDYWKAFYKEYGETWVKDVPRKIKAALISNKKVAAKNDEVKPGQIRPLAHAKFTTGGIRVEGIYQGANKKNLLFVADFDKAGNVKSIESTVLG